MVQLTKKMIAEEIRRVAMGGFLSDRDRVKEAEIMLAVNEEANKRLKIAALDMAYNVEGGSNISGLVLATYENITVTKGVSYGDVQTCNVTLPVSPFLLPDGQGVYQVYPSGMPFQEFYQLPIGMVSLWLKDNQVKNILSEFYTFSNNKIVIFSDLFSQSITPQVDVVLAIADINKLGDNDILPIPAEYLSDIVTAVIARYQEPDTVRKETSQPSPSQNPAN